MRSWTWYVTQDDLRPKDFRERDLEGHGSGELFESARAAQVRAVEAFNEGYVDRDLYDVLDPDDPLYPWVKSALDYTEGEDVAVWVRDTPWEGISLVVRAMDWQAPPTVWVLECYSTDRLDYDAEPIVTVHATREAAEDACRLAQLLEDPDLEDEEKVELTVVFLPRYGRDESEPEAWTWDCEPLCERYVLRQLPVN